MPTPTETLTELLKALVALQARQTQGTWIHAIRLANDFTADLLVDGQIAPDVRAAIEAAGFVLTVTPSPIVVKTYPIARTYMLPSPIEREGLEAAGIPRDNWPQCRVVPTNERRRPRAGEWYISGTTPEGYYATADLSSPHLIGTLLRG